VQPDDLRTRIGMLFQQPVVFPKSIYENTIFGVKRLRLAAKRDLAAVAEAALREAALWDEVKDRLHESAMKLSVGQQQRLCLARTLSMRPEVVLMDEPTSALDPRSTEAIEQLMIELKQRHTIVLVTHNIAQARRVCDWLACVCVSEGAGELAETACCDQMLDNPRCQAVVEYLKN
jgi:phosphate transport system ATP-binding protein